MEEIKVKEYIRTKEGTIFQIKGIMKRVDHILYDTDIFGIISNTELQYSIKNHDKDLIRLLEVRRLCE